MSLSIIIIIIIRPRRQQRSVASTQSGHDEELWTIRHECWMVYRRRSAGSMNGAGVLAVAANQDQNWSQFLLLRPVIMRGELACGHRVSPHGRTTSFVSRRWHPEHREPQSGWQLLCFWQSHASISRGSYALKSTNHRSFWRRVFPVNHLHRYRQQSLLSCQYLPRASDSPATYGALQMCFDSLTTEQEQPSDRTHN